MLRFRLKSCTYSSGLRGAERERERVLRGDASNRPCSYGFYKYEVNACIFKVQPLLFVWSRVEKALPSMAKLQGPQGLSCTLL